jgi:hypothetical protein
MEILQLLFSRRCPLVNTAQVTHSSSLYSHCIDRIANCVSNSSSTVARAAIGEVHAENAAFQPVHCRMLGMCCLATGVVSFFVSRSLPSNGSIRHNMLSRHLSRGTKENEKILRHDSRLAVNSESQVPRL